jgi:hypothetical protein
MNGLNEEYFVSTFVKKSHQERLLHELTSEKKRNRGLDRFSHHAGELLDMRFMVMNKWDPDNLPAFFCDPERAEEPCVLMSADPWLDGRSLPFSKALRASAFSAESSIILGHGFCAVFGEAEKGGREMYLLQKENG